MKTIYSRVTAALILGAASSYAAESNTLEEALSQAKVTATLGWYGQFLDAKGGEKDNGFSNGFAEVGFETAPIQGVSLGIKGFGSAKTSEENDNDYKNTIEDNTVLSEAYLKIGHEGMGKIVIGRQAVDFNWMSDYIEGATVEVNVLENLTFNAAWARKYGVVEFDEISESFDKINGNDGVYMLEAKYTPLEAVEINPYIYYGEHLFNAYGTKAILNLEPIEALKTSTMLHYATIYSDVSGIKDGSFIQGEEGLEFLGANIALGYIKIDKNGMGGLGEIGDQMPFEEGNHILDADAKTPYVRAEYEIQGIKLSAIYGETKYQDTIKLKEKELNLQLGYEIVKNLEASMMYVDVDNDDKTQSYNGFKVMGKYTWEK